MPELAATSAVSSAPRPSGGVDSAPNPTGASSPLAALGLLVRWELASIGTTMVPIIVVVQTLLAIGIVIGFGLLIPSIDPATATFLSTGAPTVLLMTVGLVILPQGVSTAKATGTFAYLRSLPVPRSMLLLSELSVWSVVALPGIAGAILAAWWRYDLTFSFDWLVLVPTSLMIILTATAVGYAIAVALPQTLAMVVSQILVFFVLLFSPITFPASQLPGWFQTVHDYLPMQAAADAMRAGLASTTHSADVRDLLVLAVWCIIGVAISLRALSRRD